MTFVHLHCHDTYSTLDSAMTTKKMVTRAKELGQKAIAQTNHGNMFGTLKFYKECKSQKIKPILGLEAYIAPVSRFDKDPDNKYNHITLLAMNETGLKNLFKLSTLSYTEGFYYKPRIDNEILAQNSEGLICLSGCLNSRISQMCLALNEATNKESKDYVKNCLLAEAREMLNIFGDRFYMELQKIVTEQEIIVKIQRKLAKQLQIKCVATCDSHYVMPEDSKFQAQIIALSTNQSITSEKFRGEFTGLYLKTEKEMLELFKDMPEVVRESGLIADRCNIELPEKYDHIFPKYSDNDKDLFIKKAYEGLKNRGLDKNKDYKDRLDYEIKTIIKMGFPSYFLVVQDYCNWAKENDIFVGPGRGSAAGSLVAYCLGITNIDPIKYGLLFQRFLNLGRASLPDIDCDFDQDRRIEVIKYLEDKYGKNHVAQMAVFAEFKPRGALRDFARAQGRPIADGEKAAKLVPDAKRGREPKWQEVREKSPQLWKGDLKEIAIMAEKSEGMIKQTGTHPAGVVISPREIYQDIPLFLGKDDQVTTQWDMEDVEEVGLVKMDLLGLTALTAISTCIKLVKETNGASIDIDTIPLDDPKAFEVLCNGDTNGIFQFDGGGGIRDLAMKLQPQSIEEIAAISSLFRPGPLDSGIVSSYVKRKNKTEYVSYLVPELEPILKSTYGLMIYQEQTMKIATQLAEYSLEEADNLRKAIGKKKLEKMAKEEKKMISGMVKNGISKENAEQIWSDIKTFADYGFNLSHAIAYSTITYQTTWLKAHYPLQFYCALLSLHHKERDKIMTYLSDCKQKDLQVLPPDINESDIDFTVTAGETIRFGFAAIRDVGEKVSHAIIEARQDKPFKNIFDFYDRTYSLGVNKRTIDALAKAGALDTLEIPRAAAMVVAERLGEYNKKLKAYEKKMETYGKRVERYEQREYDIKEAMSLGKKPPKSLKIPVAPEPPEVVTIPDIEELSLKDLLLYEKEMLGLYVTSHPLYNYSNEMVIRTNAHTASLIDFNQGDIVTLLGIISLAKHITTRAGKKMATFELEDLNGQVQVTVFSQLYKKYKDLLQEGNVILLTAKIDTYDQLVRKLIATHIEVLPDKDTQVTQETPKSTITLDNPSEKMIKKIKDIVSENSGDKDISVFFKIGEYTFELENLSSVSQKGLKELLSLV